MASPLTCAQGGLHRARKMPVRPLPAPSSSTCNSSHNVTVSNSSCWQLCAFALAASNVRWDSRLGVWEEGEGGEGHIRE
eukprot:1458192-Rhodomonas_salina.1